MRLACSTCGRSYPSDFSTCTCRLCGGMIENAEVSTGLHYQMYLYDEEWYAWREKMNSAPPRPLTEEGWLKTCLVFNGCAFCGFETIDERLLVVPTRLGGKLYTYNVLPACKTCAIKIRQSQQYNPLKALHTLDGLNQSMVKRGLAYLESLMLNAVFEEFDFEQDSIEIICRVQESTSIKPFDGIKAKKVSIKPGKIAVTKHAPYFTFDEETAGISWRLLDE